MNIRKTGFALLMTLTLICGFSLSVACDGDRDDAIVPTTTNPIAETTYPLNIVDQLGRTVTIESEPQRIISLSPSNTEIVYALGLQDRLVGVTDYCNYPEVALDKPKVGGFSTADVELVADAEPDLIIAGNIHASKVIPQLEELGYTVLALKS